MFDYQVAYLDTRHLIASDQTYASLSLSCYFPKLFIIDKMAQFGDFWHMKTMSHRRPPGTASIFAEESKPPPVQSYGLGRVQKYCNSGTLNPGIGDRCAGTTICLKIVEA